MVTLTLKNIHKFYGEVEVLKNINLDIAAGEFVVFIGPSGCGKSTLLRMIAGLEDISSGTLEIDGAQMNDVRPSKRGLAMVFQSYALYPHMSVFDNLAFSLKLAKFGTDAVKERVLKAANVLQITELLERLPKHLSGGQRQRVAIGRAIVREPKVFLFDEPLSNLDAALRSSMRIELADLHKTLGTTMIYVTHDQVEAMTLADKIVVLYNGNIEQVGVPIDLYQKPQTPFVAGFIGSPKMNFLRGDFAKSYDAEICGLRPEHILFAKKADGQIAGNIRHVELFGADSLCHVDAGDLGTLLVRSEGISEKQAGNRVYMNFAQENLHRFADNQRLAD